MENMSQDNVRPLRRPAGAQGGEGRRLRANWPAELRADGRRVACTVLDISSAGASVRLEGALGASDLARLVIGVRAPIAAEVVWRKSGRVGLRFLKMQRWIADLRARRFDPAAWITRG
jgi:PilZ domain